MKKIATMLALALALVSCETANTTGCRTSKRCRITYYSGPQPVAAGGRATVNRSAAAHPKYPFGTKIRIPELEPYLGHADYVIEDRGSAVTSAKASRGRADVIDIYVKNQSVLNRMRAHAPEYMIVEL